MDERDPLRSGEVVARARRGVLRPLERDERVEHVRVGALGDERDRPVRLLRLPRLPPGLTHVVLAAPRGAGRGSRPVRRRPRRTASPVGTRSTARSPRTSRRWSNSKPRRPVARSSRRGSTAAPARVIGAWKSAPGQPTGRNTDPCRCPGQQGAHTAVITLDHDVHRRPRLVDRARELGVEVRAVELRVRVPERVPRLEVASGELLERDDLHGSRGCTHGHAYSAQLPVAVRPDDLHFPAALATFDQAAAIGSTASDAGTEGQRVGNGASMEGSSWAPRDSDVDDALELLD